MFGSTKEETAKYGIEFSHKKLVSGVTSTKRKRVMEEENNSSNNDTTSMAVDNAASNECTFDVDDLAKFAIDEHNKKQNSMLEFQKVVHVKDQVVAGKMYYITVETTNAGNNKDYHYYEAKVWVKPWLNFKELQEFKYVGSTPDDGTVL